MVLHLGSGVSVKRSVTGRYPGMAVTNRLCASGFRTRWSILVNLRNKRNLPPGRSTHGHRAKRHLTSWRLDPPSNAIALQVPAIRVRWFDRMRIRRISRNPPPSGDTSRTTRTRGHFEMRAFCRSLKKAGAQHSQSPVKAGHTTAMVRSTILQRATQFNIAQSRRFAWRWSAAPCELDG